MLPLPRCNSAEQPCSAYTSRELKLEAAVKFTKTAVAYSGPDKPHLNNSHIAALLLSLEFTHRERMAPCVSSCQIYSSAINQ